MGLFITVRGGKIVQSEKLDLAELEALKTETLRNDALRAALAVVFEMPEPEQTKDVRCGVFLAAVETVLREARAGLKGTRVYYVYETPMPGIIPKGSASGAGVMIDGRRCLIMGGVNECTLTTYGQDETGEWTPVSVEDVRHMKVIMTDSQGELEIRSRSKPGVTLKFLRRLKKSFSALPVKSELTVTIG
jgi:hypothetical protein